MDIKVIERALERPGKSKTGLAGALRVPNSAVTALLNGGRELKAREVPLVRKYLGLDTVPLVGYVEAGGETIYFPSDVPFDRVPAIESATDKTVAVEVRGESLGAAFDRALVYYDDVHRPPTRELFNKLCIVGLADGRVVIKKIQPTKTKGLYHLLANVGPAILDVEIEWAARVLQVVPR